jgi:hypothetical protein
VEKSTQDVKRILKNSRSITEVVGSIDFKSIRDRSKKEDFINIDHIITHQEMIFLNSCSYFRNRIEEIYPLDYRLDKGSTVSRDLSLIPDNLIGNVIETMCDSPKKILNANTRQCVFQQQKKDKKQWTGTG